MRYDSLDDINLSLEDMTFDALSLKVPFDRSEQLLQRGTQQLQ